MTLASILRAALHLEASPVCCVRGLKRHNTPYCILGHHDQYRANGLAVMPVLDTGIIFSFSCKRLEILTCDWPKGSNRSQPLYTRGRADLVV
jgi:hypothetical protein